MGRSYRFLPRSELHRVGFHSEASPTGPEPSIPTLLAAVWPQGNSFPPLGLRHLTCTVVVGLSGTDFQPGFLLTH